ncbi:MAG: hypothetical protein GEU82_18330 [Luteitalea sp.]|nr:hypothetical protein [Luteitalea sp.]
MSKPAVDRPTKSDADKIEPPVTTEEERIVLERLATIDRDRETATPADEAIERLLRRHPAP